MALSATFKADFASFYQAVDEAETKLKGFGDGADKVGARLNKMGDSFSGAKIVQDATLMVKAVEDIGGVSKLTDKELARLGATANEAVEKMKRLGMDVPPKLQDIADKTKVANKATVDWMGTLTKVAGTLGLAFSVDALVGFVGSVFDAAGAIKDLSDQWGISTTAVQKFTAAARASGVETEQVGKGIQFLTDKLGESSAEYDALLRNVGLSGTALRGMNLEDAYREVIKAIGGIKDETLQLDAATALLGPSAKKMIGAIRDGYLEAADAQKVMSEETIKRLEAAGDAWGELKNVVVIHTGEMIAAVMSATSTMTKSWGNFFSTIGLAAKDFISGQTGSATAFLAYQQAADEAAETAKKYAKDTQLVTAAQAGNQNAMRTTVQVLDDVRKKTEATKKAEQDRAQAQTAARAVQDAFTKQVEAQSKALGDLVDKFEGQDLIGKAERYAQALEYAVPVQQMTRKTQDEINKVMNDAIEVYVAAGKKAPQALLDIAKATEQVKEQVHSLNEFIGKFDPSKLGEGVKLGAPPKIDTSMFDGFGKGIAGAMSSSILKAIQGGGNLFQAAGSAIGSFILDPKQSGVGKAIEGASKKLPGLIGGAIGSAIPVIGSMIGPAIGWLSNKIAGLFGKKEHEKLRDSFVEAAGGLRELREQAAAAGVSLDALYSAKKPEQVKAAIADIQEAIKFQAGALDQARAAAERYGFTLEELGPALQRADLDKQAQQLYADFRVLNAAGVDQVAITDKMSSAVSDYVNQAKKMGFEVPNAMRPMLEAFAKSGDLLDENGNAITDLDSSGIKFAMTMTEGFQMMVDSVQKLVEALDRELNPALKEATQERHFKVFGHVYTVKEQAEGFANGTDGFRNFGKGTPAILHGWEAVVPRDDAGAFATVHGGGGDGGGAMLAPQIVINAQGAFFDTPDSLQRLAGKVSDALTAKYSVMGKLRAAV